MRYKVRTTETLEFVIEGDNADEVLDWLSGNTIREIRRINYKLATQYHHEIIEKTVMPADVSVDDYCEDIPDDDWNKVHSDALEKLTEEGCEDDED